MARTFEEKLVKYLVDEYCQGDRKEFAERVGYYKSQVDGWIDGGVKPHKATIRWLLSSVIAPEFKVAAEFKHVDFDAAKDIRPELRKVLGSALKISRNSFLRCEKDPCSAYSALIKYVTPKIAASGRSIQGCSPSSCSIILVPLICG